MLFSAPFSCTQARVRINPNYRSHLTLTDVLVWLENQSFYLSVCIIKKYICHFANRFKADNVSWQLDIKILFLISHVWFRYEVAAAGKPEWIVLCQWDLTVPVEPKPQTRMSLPTGTWTWIPIYPLCMCIYFFDHRTISVEICDIMSLMHKQMLLTNTQSFAWLLNEQWNTTMHMIDCII